MLALLRLQTAEIYVTVADYTPAAIEKDGLALKEGQFVELMDSANPHRWFVRTKPSKFNPTKMGELCLLVSLSVCPPVGLSVYQ